MDYARVKTIIKFAHCAGAIILFVIAVIQFAQLNFTQIKFIMLIYYILFGVLIVFIELGFGLVLRYFYFMQFSWGKAAFAFFVGSLIFNKNQWWELVAAIIFFVAAIGFIFLGFFYRSEENEEAAKNAPASLFQIDLPLFVSHSVVHERRSDPPAGQNAATPAQPGQEMKPPESKPQESGLPAPKI